MNSRIWSACDCFCRALSALMAAADVSPCASERRASSEIAVEATDFTARHRLPRYSDFGRFTLRVNGSHVLLDLQFSLSVPSVSSVSSSVNPKCRIQAKDRAPPHFVHGELHRFHFGSSIVNVDKLWNVRYRLELNGVSHQAIEQRWNFAQRDMMVHCNIVHRRFGHLVELRVGLHHCEAAAPLDRPKNPPRHHPAFRSGSPRSRGFGTSPPPIETGD